MRDDRCAENNIDPELDAEFRLSFYREIADLDEAHGVRLVQHADTGRIFVKKTLTVYDRSIYETLKEMKPAGIPEIAEIIEKDGQLIVIEEYVDGKTLAEITADSLMSPEEAAAAGAEICRILEPLHRHVPPIVHRDIKAGNVIRRRSGELCLVDFDASRFTDPGKNRDTELLGTEGYAAPEQYGFAQSDARTDIYGIGVLVNRLVTGRGPSEELCPGALGKVVSKCTALDPDDRYQSVSALGRELSSLGGFHTGSPLSLLRMIPGFRSGRPGSMILAACWYALVIYLPLSMTAEEAFGHEVGFLRLAAFRVVFLALGFAETFYLGNFRGIRDAFPPRLSGRPRTVRGEKMRWFFGAAVILMAAALLMMPIGAV